MQKFIPDMFYVPYSLLYYGGHYYIICFALDIRIAFSLYFCNDTVLIITQSHCKCIMRKIISLEYYSKHVKVAP